MIALMPRRWRSDEAGARGGVNSSLDMKPLSHRARFAGASSTSVRRARAAPTRVSLDLLRPPKLRCLQTTKRIAFRSGGTIQARLHPLSTLHGSSRRPRIAHRDRRRADASRDHHSTEARASARLHFELRPSEHPLHDRRKEQRARRAACVHCGPSPGRSGNRLLPLAQESRRDSGVAYGARCSRPAYHSGRPSTRAKHQERFVNGDGVVIVATLAFGKAIAARLALVAHLDRETP